MPRELLAPCQQLARALEMLADSGLPCRKFGGTVDRANQPCNLPDGRARGTAFCMARFLPIYPRRDFFCRIRTQKPLSLASIPIA